MPRGRGGARDGVVGRAYANRSDLRGQNVVAAQPQNQPGQKMAIQAASGQAYGAASAQKAAQSAVPIANQSMPMTQGSAPQGAPQGAPASPVVPLNAPTDHGLPITHGMDMGPGAGSEAMAPAPMKNDVSIQALALLNTLGDNVSPQVAMIRNYLEASASNGQTR